MAALYIQRENKGASWQVWPAPDAIPPGEIREGASYLFELRECDEAATADLLLDDAPLEALRSRDLRTAKWRWTPGFHAGVADAALRIPGAGTRHFTITTDPDLRKLTRDDFDAMVREILEDTFALFSLSAFRTGIARQRGNQPPPLARLEFLRSRCEELLQSVDAILRSPRHFLCAEQITLPAHQARRATGPEILRSFRTGVVRTERPGPSRLPQTLGGRLPAHITVRRHRNSVDIPEHRQIKACLRSWAAWLSGIAEALAKAAPSDDSEILSTAGHWAARARQMSRQLQLASGTGFMSDVGDGPAALQMSSLFRNDPVYHRFYRLWQDMNLGLAALSGDFLQMPLARTYELYELWCFLRLLRAAVQEYSPDGITLDSLFTTDAAGGVTLQAGAISVSLGADKALCFQRQYKEYWLAPDGEGSFSRTMVPDVVLTDTGLGNGLRQVIVLDAKYRINDGLNDALNSIHTYRDALVREAGTGECEGIVTAAYLLTPHVPAVDTDFRATPMPGRLFHPQYRDKFRFGAVTLRPGMSTDELRATLQTLVADATQTAR
ncbi:hypothetical protein A7A76_23320 [Lysobacter enzymogenes]|uniref:DUF2357 domain-containing protein n=1 Tax=Lysobacter enzymogenes TaxID=69 RepID=UPI0031BA6AFD|nr:hypothetical protein [Lysobacter enzymogenes]